jgi:hypothetical protein
MSIATDTSPEVDEETEREEEADARLRREHGGGSVLSSVTRPATAQVRDAKPPRRAYLLRRSG